jgi:CubicO group peptidase (beta-lactamase class C family)
VIATRRALLVFCLVLSGVAPAFTQQHADPTEITRDLTVAPPGAPSVAGLDLGAAMRTLAIPSVSIALIDQGTLVWARAWGDATEGTLYQAASLSKTVTAVAALRLVDEGRLALDRDVNTDLTQWHVPDNDFTRGHPVTLRGLLSMTAGIDVPGFPGYAFPGILPNLRQILDGTPPANSPPVRVVSVPGTRYAYSGGGYEIAQALIEAKTGQPFADAMMRLVFRPAGMSNTFARHIVPAQAERAASGHDRDGTVVPGSWRVVPEVAAGGVWSTPIDLAKLLVEILRAYRHAPDALLSPASAEAMLTRQNGGPYGLGGAVAGSGPNLVFMKRGQNIGYQSYMLIFPMTGQGIVVMTGSDNGTTLATALIRRAAVAYGWPPLGELMD